MYSEQVFCIKFNLSLPFAISSQLVLALDPPAQTKNRKMHQYDNVHIDIVVTSTLNLFINLRSVRLSACYSCSMLPNNEHCHLRYRKKAHNQENVQIMSLRSYTQHVVP